jgi:hypothetical protein
LENETTVFCNAVNSINEKDPRTTMVTMLTSASDERTSPDSTRSNIRASRRPRAAGGEETVLTRFFLAKSETNSNSLELGREFRSEGEARVEALKLGLTYYSVQEWRPVADFAGKNPELKREAVARSGSG